MSSSSSTDYKPHSHIPYGSDGSGFYSDNTIGCFNVIAAATPVVINALGLVPYNTDKYPAFVICDYGTADGGTSMPLMTDCITWLNNKYGKELQIQIVYEDQPVNDFKSLFLRLQAQIPGPPSYLKDNQNVFVTACGTGFFEKCLPNNSVHLGFSATAMHWLSKRPCTITGALHHTGISDEIERSKYSAQAAQDWEAILLHRAKELAPGGQMVIVTFCVDKEGQYLGRSNNVKESMFACMTKHWKAMAEEGVITQEEFQNTTFNNYYRTVEELSKPFTDPESAISKAGLKLVSIDTKVVECPYRAKWLQEGKKGDIASMKAHAKWYVPTTRTWSNSTFQSALSETRSEEEKAGIVDTFFQRYEDEVAKAPSDHGMDYVHAYIHLEKSAA